MIRNWLRQRFCRHLQQGQYHFKLRGADLGWGGNVIRLFDCHSVCKDCGKPKIERGQYFPRVIEERYWPHGYDASGWPLDEDGNKLPMANQP